MQASSALRPADLSAALVHCARLDLKEDIASFAQRLTKEGNPAVNPAVPALAAMLANNQDLAHACFEASGKLSLLRSFLHVACMSAVACIMLNVTAELYVLCEGILPQSLSKDVEAEAFLPRIK